jgi:hypothetical protein
MTAKQKKQRAEVTLEADGSKVTRTKSKGRKSSSVTTTVERPKDPASPDTGATDGEAATTTATATTTRPRRTGRTKAAKETPDLEALRRPVENAAAIMEEAKAEAGRLEESARRVLANAKATYREALAAYRDACRRAGAKCEFSGGRAANVSERVSFLVEKVEKGLKVTVKGKPETERIIPSAKLKVSINKSAYDYCDEVLGPREVVGNKGGSLSNCLRAALKGSAR